MKNQFAKKLLALTLTIVMSASLLSACGNSQEESKAESSSAVQESSKAEESKADSSEAVVEDGFVHDPVLNELGVEPFVKEGEEVTITIGLAQNANIEDYDTNYYTTMLEEVTGVNIEFLLFTSGENQDKLQMMVAGGEKLPDIIMWGIDDALAQEWGAEGYLLPLEDYFANSSVYAAEGYARVLADSGLDILDYQTQADGHIWSFPSYFESGTNPINRVYIYQPWLEALNLEMPTTTDEFYEVLKAFKTQDPNGNGKADEVPMVGSEITTENYSGYLWQFVMNAFVHSTCQKDWLISTDGVLSVSYTQDGWKEGVKYLRKLVEEGLFDPVSFTQDTETFTQIINSDPQLVGVNPWPSKVNASHPSKNYWASLEPLTGPDGFCSTAFTPDLPSNKAYITADCEHPEVAFRILDLMCREDFTITSRWGKQGENWDYVSNLKETEIEALMSERLGRTVDYDWENLEFFGCPAYFFEYNNIWSQPNNIHWMNNAVCFRTIEVAAGYFVGSCEIGSINQQNYESCDAFFAAKPEETISKIKYESADIHAEANLIRDALKEYVYEKLGAWCLGTSDVDAEWDEYLAELEEIGLSKWLEIQQAGWK